MKNIFCLHLVNKFALENKQYGGKVMRESLINNCAGGDLSIT